MLYQLTSNFLKTGEYSLGFNLKRKIYVVVLEFFRLAFMITPSNFLRVCMLKLAGAKVGPGTYVNSRVRFEFPWRITIGKSSYIGADVYLDCRGGNILIGDSVDISEGVFIYTLSHDIYSETFATKGADVNVGSFAWVCAGAKVLPATTMRNGCVLGANSVLTGTTNEYCLYSGVPAIFVKELPRNRSSMVRTQIESQS